MRNREETLVLRVLNSQYKTARIQAKRERDVAIAAAKQDYHDKLLVHKQIFDEAHQEYISGNWDIFSMFLKGLTIHDKRLDG